MRKFFLRNVSNRHESFAYGVGNANGCSFGKIGVDEKNLLPPHRGSNNTLSNTALDGQNRHGDETADESRSRGLGWGIGDISDGYESAIGD